MKCVLRWCVIPLLAVTALAQTESTTAKPRKHRAKPAEPAVTMQDVQALRDALAAQQQQINDLKMQLQQKDQTIQQAQAAAVEAKGRADDAAAQAAQQGQAVTALRGDVADLKGNVTNTALTLQETQKDISGMESPMAIHYKGITITPGGFLAAETVWRQHALGSDINTPFNSLPMPGATADNMSEFFASGRQSRISMLAQGKLKSATFSGYVEADFLSAATTSNNNESNSYSLRQRQAWGQAVLSNGWSFTGGQMWSLVTETKKGLDNRSEALPMTIDPQYNVGFSWARQEGFRITKNFSNRAWFGFSVENPQTTVALHGNSNNFVVGSAGTSGGLYNPAATYSFNYMPDFVVKTAFEPGWGHYEIFGVVSEFRDRVFPNATATPASASGAFNDTRTAGGVGANLRMPVTKHLDFGVHFLGGDGIGRYGTAGLADATVRPDGTLAPIRSFQGLGTLEAHSKRMDVYFNVGSEYAGRTAFVNSTGKGVGYGSPLLANTGCLAETVPGTATGGMFPTSSQGFLPGGLANCTADTRELIEGTAGFWYRIYNGPMGRLQFGPQYSYITRNTWHGSPPGQNPSGTENMFLTSFRYYLP